MQENTSKAVLITGANRGIGLQMVRSFAQNGYNIWACARKHTTEYEQTMTQIAEENGVWVQPLYFDMTNYDAMKAEITEKVLKSNSTVDVLVNNAGVAHGGFFSMTKVAAIRDVFEVNLFAGMELTQLVIRKMIRQKSGCIINMSSIAAFNLRPGNSAYGVSKVAVKAWTETLGAELAQYGIRVNAIAPSLTDTEMARQMEEKAEEQMIHASAMGRLAKTEEISDVAVYLASDKASFINGQTIVVNGGEA